MKHDYGNTQSSEMKYASKRHSEHNPNTGENKMSYYDKRGAVMGSMSSGVGDGLSMADGISDVKNAEMVTVNQRPEGNRKSAGRGMTIGVS